MEQQSLVFHFALFHFQTEHRCFCCLLMGQHKRRCSTFCSVFFTQKTERQLKFVVPLYFPSGTLDRNYSERFGLYPRGVKSTLLCQPVSGAIKGFFNEL